MLSGKHINYMIRILTVLSFDDLISRTLCHTLILTPPESLTKTLSSELRLPGPLGPEPAPHSNAFSGKRARKVRGLRNYASYKVDPRLKLGRRSGVPGRNGNAQRPISRTSPAQCGLVAGREAHPRGARNAPLRKSS